VDGLDSPSSMYVCTYVAFDSLADKRTNLVVTSSVWPSIARRTNGGQVRDIFYVAFDSWADKGRTFERHPTDMYIPPFAIERRAQFVA
jgi:hypothetical protein